MFLLKQYCLILLPYFHVPNIHRHVFHNVREDIGKIGVGGTFMHRCAWKKFAKKVGWVGGGWKNGSNFFFNRVFQKIFPDPPAMVGNF